MIRVGPQRDILGECPLWSVAEQALYWVDIRRPALRRLDHASGAVETHAMPELIGAAALAGPGRLLLALGTRVAAYDWATRRFRTVAELPDPVPGHRFNDGRCDRQGRFWVGTMHNDTRAPEGTLYRLEPGAGLLPVHGGIRIPNSLAWSPGGEVMYFADSLAYAVTRHDFDPGTGAMGEAATFADTERPGFPDGSTVDAEGFLWTAEFNGGRVVRRDARGRVDRVLPVPVPRPTSCAFGGPDLGTLYVTTASQQMTPEELEAQPLAGALLAYRPGVCGLAEPDWAGPLPEEQT